MDRLQKITLMLILLLAFAVRIFWLQKSPPSLNWDEVSLGYNAYSILKTGKDEYGQKFPSFLRSFDDYKPALYAYSAISFVKVLGLNEYSVRFPSVISGVVSVLFIYLLALKVSQNNFTATASALLMTIEPWSVLFSRAAYEANLALPLTLAGIYFLIKSNFQKFTFMTLSAFFLILSLYAYHSPKIFVPILIINFIFYHQKQIIKNKRKIVYFLILSFILCLPLIYATTTNRDSLNRFKSTSTITEITSKPLETIKQMSFRYLSYFSPINLFVRGTPEPTQKIQNFAMFYSFEFFFWSLGLYWLVKNFKNSKLLLILLLTTPLPAIITWNWFYPARILPYLAINTIIVAQGMYVAFAFTKTKLKPFVSYFAYLGFAAFALSQTLSFAVSLLFSFPYLEKGNWQYGMKELIVEASKVDSTYDKIVIETRTAQPHIFTLFYSQFDPAKYQDYSQYIAKPRKEYSFDKFEFRDVYWPKDQYLTNTLLIGPDSSLPTTKVSNDPGVIFIKDVYGTNEEFLGRIVGRK